MTRSPHAPAACTLLALTLSAAALAGSSPAFATTDVHDRRTMSPASALVVAIGGGHVAGTVNGVNTRRGVQAKLGRLPV